MGLSGMLLRAFCLAACALYFCNATDSLVTSNRILQVPSEWTCQDSEYDNQTNGICNCNCGTYDPDCDNLSMIVGCESDQFNNVCTSPNGVCDSTIKSSLPQCVLDFSLNLGGLTCQLPFYTTVPVFDTGTCTEAEANKLGDYKPYFQCIFDALPADCRSNETVQSFCDSLTEAWTFIIWGEGFTRISPIPSESKQCFRNQFCASAAAGVLEEEEEPEEPDNGNSASTVFSGISVAAATVLSIQMILF